MQDQALETAPFPYRHKLSIVAQPDVDEEPVVVTPMAIEAMSIQQRATLMRGIIADAGRQLGMTNGHAMQVAVGMQLEDEVAMRDALAQLSSASETARQFSAPILTPGAPSPLP